MIMNKDSVFDLSLLRAGIKTPFKIAGCEDEVNAQDNEQSSLNFSPNISFNKGNSDKQINEQFEQLQADQDVEETVDSNNLDFTDNQFLTSLFISHPPTIIEEWKEILDNPSIKDFTFDSPPTISYINSSPSEEKNTIEEKVSQDPPKPSEEVEEEIDTSSKKSIQSKKNQFLKIQRTENLDDSKVRWEICLDGEWYPDDDLIICEMCLWAVHQSWYSRDLAENIPEDEWFCERWTFLRTNNKLKEDEVDDIRWTLCYDCKGIIVHADPLEWVHLTWVNWINEIYFDEDSNFTKIIGEVAKDRFKIKCKLCNRKKGACIQCDYKDCIFNFHVTWAINKGIIKIWSEMNQMKDPNDSNCTLIFCPKHQKVGYHEAKNKGFQYVMEPAQKSKKTKRSESSKQASKKTSKRQKHWEDSEEEYNNEYMVNLISNIVNKKAKTEKKKSKRVANNKISEVIPWVQNNKICLRRNKESQRGCESNPSQNDQNQSQIVTETNSVNNQVQDELKRLYSNMSNLSFNKDSEREEFLNPQNLGLMSSIQKIIENKSSKKDNKDQGRPKKSKSPIISANQIFSVESRLGRIIGIRKGKIKNVTDAFINYSITNDLVDKKSHTYLLFKDFELKQIIGLDTIASSELSSKLLPFLTEIKGYNMEDVNCNSNLQEESQNSQSRNLRLLEQMKDKLSISDKKSISDKLTTGTNPSILQNSKVNNDQDEDSEDSDGGLTLKIRKCSYPSEYQENEPKQTQMIEEVQPQNLAEFEPDIETKNNDILQNFNNLSKEQLIKLLSTFVK